MRNQPVEFFLVDTGGFERLGGNIAQRIDRNLEHLAAFHHDRRICRSRLVKVFRRTNRVIQQLLVLAVRTEMTGQDAGLAGRLHDHGARAVSEQDAGVAIVPVDKLGDALGPDDECALRLPGLDKLISCRQRVDETRCRQPQD